MATDFILTGYQAIKALLEADAALTTGTSRVRVWVWFDGNREAPEPEKRVASKDAGTLPELKLDWLSMTDSLRNATRTFGNTDDSTAAFIGTETHEYVITLTVNDVRLPVASAAITDVRRVLRAGAKVNVGDVGACIIGQLRIRNEKTTRAEAAGHDRRVATIIVPVTITYHGTGQLT